MDDDDPPNVVTSISRHELTAVAQRDLLHWLNQTVQTDYGQITDVNDGIAHLQILDAIWPGASVPLHRLNFHPRTRDDRERNLRVVRQTLQRLRVVEDAPLDVEAIAKGGASSFSACNDFLRWCHAVVQRNCPAVSRKYDGHGRRREAQTRQSRSSPSSANRRKGTPYAGDRWGQTSSFSPTSFSPKGASYLDLYDEPSDTSPSPTMARREAMYEYVNEREGFVRRRPRPRSAGVRSSAPEFRSNVHTAVTRQLCANRPGSGGALGYAPGSDTEGGATETERGVGWESRATALRARPATARVARRSTGLHRWAAKARAGAGSMKNGENGRRVADSIVEREPNETTAATAPRETTDDEEARAEEVKDRVSGVPTTPRRVQSTRLSAWANKSRGEVLTPVKSDDTDDTDDTDDDDDDDDDTDHEDLEGDGDEGSGAAPAPVRWSPSQNLADARRELRLRRSEEIERGARRILIAGAAGARGDETDGDAADENENENRFENRFGVQYVDDAEAAERRDRIMRETKAELREIRRRETERRLEREGVKGAEAERERVRELRREQLRRSHGLKEARSGVVTPAAPVGTANLTVVVEEEETTTTTTTQLATTRSQEETAAATRRKRADLESLAEYLKWELAREVRAYDAKREEVASLTRERDEAVHRLGLAEARRRMGNLARS